MAHDRTQRHALGNLPLSIVGHGNHHLGANKLPGVIAIDASIDLGKQPRVVISSTAQHHAIKACAVLQGVVVEVGGARVAHQGAPAAALLRSARAGPAFIDQPLYNLARGYGSYVVAAVGILIVQQVMLMAIASLVGTWLEGRHRRSAPLA